MARPEKKGINYFNIDCDQDDKLEFIIAKHALIGYGIVVQIWRKIYQYEGYFCYWNDKVVMLFAKDNGVDVETVNAVVETCFQEDLFSRDFFQSYGILTSSGVQKRWLKIVKEAKRKDQKIDEKLSILEFTPEKVEFTPEETPVNPGKSTQSKVKESKVKERVVVETEFKPPNHQVLEDFFKEKAPEWSAEKCKKEAGKFIDHNSSIGWKIGKSEIPMKDWTGVANAWIKTEIEWQHKNPKKNPVQVQHTQVGKTQVSEPSKEPTPEKRIEIAKNSVVSSFNEFCRKGYYEDFANTVYKALLFLESQQFMSFIEGKYDYFTEKGAAKFRSKPAQEVDMKNGIMRTMEENSLRGANDDERHVAEGKKEAVKEFFQHLQEFEIRIENIF